MHKGQITLTTMDRVMVFKATFNTFSVISWQSVFLVEESRLLGEVTDKLYHIMPY